MAKTKKQAKRKTYKQSSSSSSIKKELQQRASSEQRHDDLISELPDDILARIMSLVAHKYAVRASVTCRRWKDMYLQASDVCLYIVSRGAGAAVQSMERMLRQRLQVQRPRVVYNADVPTERECMARLVKLAGAVALEVYVECADVMTVHSSG